MKKVLGIIITLALFGMVASQAQFVSAKSEGNRRLTSPLTSPCKPGWGYGDKNHCHSGPPGLSENVGASNAATKNKSGK